MVEVDQSHFVVLHSPQSDHSLVYLIALLETRVS